MKKLELKHLAPYLPHGLKAMYNESIVNVIGNPLYAYHYGNRDIKISNISIDGLIDRSLVCKPILHPLSDLAKPITIEEFVPADILYGIWLGDRPDTEAWNYHFANDLKFYVEHTKYAPFWVVKLLYQWHFDIDGLIEAGLAIDINTLK